MFEFEDETTVSESRRSLPARRSAPFEWILYLLFVAAATAGLIVLIDKLDYHATRSAVCIVVWAGVCMVAFAVAIAVNHFRDSGAR